MNWLDLALILFAIIMLFISVKKGFMTSLLSNFSFTVNAILSFFLCKPIGWVFNKFGLGNAIASAYSEKFLKSSVELGKNLMDMSKETLSDFIPSALKTGDFNGFVRTLLNWFINKDSLYDTLHASNHKTRSLSDIISSAYASFFVSIISFVTSVLLLYLVVWLISLLVKKLREIGFIKTVDGFLGAIYGLFRCLLILITLSLIIKLISPFNFMEPVTTYINNSLFGGWIYGQINNLLDNYLNFSDIINKIFNKN